MSAEVIDLASRRPTAAAEHDCAACQLRALIARVQDHIETHDGQLLTDWPTQIEVFADVLATVSGALEENDERTSK